MAIQFWLPMIASILQGGIGMAMDANRASRETNEGIRLASLRRRELQPIIDDLRSAKDYFQLEENLVRDFSRGANQMAAESAQTGMTNAGSGGLDQVRGDLLGAMIASLAETKMADQAQRQQLLAEILSDPSLYDAFRTPENVTGNTILGALGGGMAGAGTQLQAYLSSPEGLAVLGSLAEGRTPSNPVSSDSPMEGPGGWMPTSSDQIRQLNPPNVSAFVNLANAFPRTQASSRGFMPSFSAPGPVTSAPWARAPGATFPWFLQPGG